MFSNHTSFPGPACHRPPLGAELSNSAPRFDGTRGLLLERAEELSLRIQGTTRRMSPAYFARGKAVVAVILERYGK